MSIYFVIVYFLLRLGIFISSYFVIQLKFLVNFRLYLTHNYKFNSFKSYPISTVTSRDELIRLITELKHVEWTLHYAFGLYKQRKNFLLSITNKMQRYTLFFIAVNAVRVSGGETA
jgi:hypothetical protein